MTLHQLNFDNQDRIEVSIARLQMFEPKEGYYLAFSGGKDSIVLKDLAIKAGVKFISHYSLGGLDPPELVQFIKKYHGSTVIDRPKDNIWKMIETKGFPKRQSRWCCELIKEKSGSGWKVLTGIRWQESPRRRNRAMVETCRTDGTKTFIHPIIDWTNNEVWDYIKTNNIPYCSLYNEGFKRLGCVLCPMLTPKQTQIQLNRFPKQAEAWYRAGKRFYERGTDGVKRWRTYDDFWNWWISRKGEAKNTAQCVMFDN